MSPPDPTPTLSCPLWFRSLAGTTVHDSRFMAFDGFAAWACGFATLRDAWTACPRPDWLFWLALAASQSEEDVRPIVRAACEGARRAMTAHRIHETEAWAALDAAARWADGVCDPVKVAEAGCAALAAGEQVSGRTLGEGHARRLSVYAAAACASIAAHARVLHGAVPPTEDTLRMRMVLCDNAGAFPASALASLHSADDGSEARGSTYDAINRELAEVVRAVVHCPAR